MKDRRVLTVDDYDNLSFDHMGKTDGGRTLHDDNDNCVGTLFYPEEEKLMDALRHGHVEYEPR